MLNLVIDFARYEDCDRGRSHPRRLSRIYHTIINEGKFLRICHLRFHTRHKKIISAHFYLNMCHYIYASLF